MSQSSDSEEHEPSMEEQQSKVKTLSRRFEKSPHIFGKWKSTSNLVFPASSDDDRRPSSSHNRRITQSNISENVVTFKSSSDTENDVSETKILRTGQEENVKVVIHSDFGKKEFGKTITLDKPLPKGPKDADTKKKNFKLNRFLTMSKYSSNRVNISYPTNFEHLEHVGFDEESGKWIHFMAPGTPFNQKTFDNLFDNPNDLHKIGENTDNTNATPLLRSKTTGTQSKPKSLHFSKYNPDFYRELSEKSFSRSPSHDTKEKLVILRPIKEVSKPINTETSQKSSVPLLPPAPKNTEEKPSKLNLSPQVVKPHTGAIRKTETKPILKNPQHSQSTIASSSSPKVLIKKQDKCPEIPKLPPQNIKKANTPSKSSLRPNQPTAQNFASQKSSDLEVVDKLQQIKLMFASTNAENSEKYNKTLQLLNDFMAEVKQESSSQLVENDSGFKYSPMKNVPNETKEDIKKNVAQSNNRKINFETSVSQMAPTLLINRSKTESDQDNGGENVKEVLKGKTTNDNSQNVGWDVQDEIKQILQEIKHTEVNYLRNLEHLIDEFKQRVNGLPLVEPMFPILENLFTHQCNFTKTIRARGENLSLILKAFLEYEQLFDSYVIFFREKAKVFKTGGMSFNNNEFDESKYLSASLLSRLNNYKLLIKDIAIAIEDNTNDMEFAKKIIKMLNVILDKCNNPVVENELGSLTDMSEGTNRRKSLAEATRRKSHNCSEYGELLLRDNFKIDDESYFTVFLFEKVIVLAKEETNTESEIFYRYKSLLELDQVILLPLSENKKVIKLKDSSRDVVIKLEAISEEIQNFWRFEINKLLQPHTA